MAWVLIAVFYVAATLHFPIEHFSGVPVYMLVLPVLLLFLIRDVARETGNRIYFIVYLLAVSMAFALSLGTRPVEQVATASLSYLLMPTVAFMATLKSAPSRLRMLARINFWIALGAGVAAFYQITADPLLFGLYAGGKYESAASWGTLRASSLFASPQVYAAYMAFSAILHDIFGKRLRLAGFAVLAAGAGLSGSVAPGAALIVYLLISRFGWGTVLMMAVLVSAHFYLLGNYELFDRLDPASPVYRIASAVFLDEFGGSGNEERVERWVQSISLTPPIAGNGIGSASTLVGGEDRFNTESYILSVYYEGGLVLLTAFLALIGKLALGFRRQHGLAKRLAFLAAFLLYAQIVHAFYAWSLLIVWFILFGLIEKADAKRPVMSSIRGEPTQAMAAAHT